MLALQTTRNKTAACALAGLLTLSSGAAMAGPALKNVPLPRPRPAVASSAPGAASPKSVYQTASLTPAASALPKDEPALPFSSGVSISKTDLGAVKQVIELARKGKTQEATDL